jgi:hypothetical protein
MAAAMPDAREGRIQPEMYLSYSGGVNAFAFNHREMGRDSLRHLVNGTVRNGWVQTRPHFECIVPTYESAEDKTVFETGKIQGSAYYRFGTETIMIYAIDGNLFSFDPIRKRVLNLNPESGRPFSKFADFVYFSTRAGYLVSGDGVSPQVITEGYASRLAVSASPNNEVPTGLMMADDWGRLAIVDPDRRRIRFSNHELDPDPAYKPLGFDEATDYYLNAAYFQVPDHIGRIVWIGFMPWLDTDTGAGPLAVLGERGMRYYDVSIDRGQWSTQDISGTMLPNIGGLSHRAQVARADTLIFSDQNGRIRNLKNARRDEQTLAVKRFDRKVYPYYERESRDLRRFRLAAEWNERVLVAVEPESVWIRDGENNSPSRYNVRHRGLVVYNGEVTELSDERNLDIWDGLWTGIYPATLDTGSFGLSGAVMPEDLCIALSVDPDGINRPYVIREDGAGRYDIAPRNSDGDLGRKQIEMQIITRPLDFSARDTDYSFELKKLDRGVIRIGERYGQTDLTGYVQSDQDYLSREWFSHKTNADHDLAFVTNSAGVCEVQDGRPGHDPKLKLPADQKAGKDPAHCTSLQAFYKASIRLVVTGWARIEEMMFDAVKQTDPDTFNTQCHRPSTPERNYGCKPNLWGYNAREETSISCN